MRVALLVVAFLATLALVSATSLTLVGTYYTDNACSAGATTVTLAITGSSSSGTYSLPCTVISGTGSTAIVATGACTTTSEGAGAVNSWEVSLTQGSTCPASGATGTASGPQGGTSYAIAADTSSTLTYPDKQVLTFFTTGNTGCFTATSCTYSAGASTLVAPTFLLVALAFVARKLSL